MIPLAPFYWALLLDASLRPARSFHWFHPALPASTACESTPSISRLCRHLSSMKEKCQTQSHPGKGSSIIPYIDQNLQLRQETYMGHCATTVIGSMMCMMDWNAVWRYEKPQIRRKVQQRKNQKLSQPVGMAKVQLTLYKKILISGGASRPSLSSVTFPAPPQSYCISSGIIIGDSYVLSLVCKCFTLR